MPCHVLTFQELSRHHISCHVVSMAMSMLHSLKPNKNAWTNVLPSYQTLVNFE